MKIPNKMRDSLSKAREEQRLLFEETYKSLEQVPLVLLK